MNEPVPQQALSILVPEPHAADLILAATLDDDPAREAWERWRGRAGDARAALAQDAVVARTMLPLLYDSFRRNRLDVNDETATYLRSALLRERLRAHAYREIVQEVTARLDAAGVQHILIKGASIGERYYAEEALRHSHDIEILVQDRAAAESVMPHAGFRLRNGTWHHSSALPLRLHEHLFGRATAFDESAIRTSRRLDATHDLAVVLVSASRSLSRSSGRWIADARAIERSGDVDWKTLASIVSNAGASIAALTQLEWLAAHRVCSVPSEVTETLRARGARASAEEIADTVTGLHAGSFRLWRSLWAHRALRKELIRRAIPKFLPRIT